MARAHVEAMNLLHPFERDSLEGIGRWQSSIGTALRLALPHRFSALLLAHAARIDPFTGMTASPHCIPPHNKKALERCVSRAFCNTTVLIGPSTGGPGTPASPYET